MKKATGSPESYQLLWFMPTYMRPALAAQNQLFSELLVGRL